MIESVYNYIIMLSFVLVAYITLGVSRKFKLPEPLILFLLGIIMQFFIHIEFFTIIEICLVLLIFDVGAHLVPKKFDNHALKFGEFILSSWFIFTLLFWVFLSYFWSYNVWYLNLTWSVFMSSIITASSQFELLKSFKIKYNRLYFLTELEDNLSNSFMMIVGLISLLFLTNYSSTGTALNILLKTLSQIFVDLSVGVFLGFIMLFFIVKVFKRRFVHYLTFIFAILIYFISVYFGGFGLIAVFIASIFYNNVKSKEAEMHEFVPFIRNLVYILVFIFIGYFIIIDNFAIVWSVILFMIYLLIRYVLLKIMLKYTQSFIAFDCPKGLATGALLLFTYKSLSWCCGIREMTFFSIIAMFFIWCILFSYSLNLYTHKITN